MHNCCLHGCERHEKRVSFTGSYNMQYITTIYHTMSALNLHSAAGGSVHGLWRVISQTQKKRARSK